MRDLVALSDDWWFVVHNADLLAKLDPDNDELSQLRDTFILNYAEAMLGDKVILLFVLKSPLRLINPFLIFIDSFPFKLVTKRF